MLDLGWALSPMMGILIRERKGGFEEGEKTQQREGSVKRRHVGLMLPQAMDTCSPREREDPPLELSEVPWPCQPVSFGLLASRAGREYTSTAGSHQVCSHLLQQP